MSTSKQFLDQRFSSSGVEILVRGTAADGRLIVDFEIESKGDCLLHWGLSRRGDAAWHVPPEAAWPPDTSRFAGNAVQTLCRESAGQPGNLRILLDRPESWGSLPFVLYFPAEKRWVKNGRQDFRIPLPRVGEGLPAPREVVEQETREGEWRRFDFPLGEEESLAAAVREQDAGAQVVLASDAEAPLLLHWGLAGRFRHQWQRPVPEICPPETAEFDNRAVRTPFLERRGLRWLQLDLRHTGDASPPRGINLVLYQPGTDRWLKSQGRDIYLPLAPGSDLQGPLSSQQLEDLAEPIVAAEMSKGSWTLMHRFNLCHDLLAGAQDDAEALALLYAWLRFSAIRQLDWQRNYNTKPRELSHAQERLTSRLAEIYRNHPETRFWTRLMLSTLGRGGEGQKVRDEILNIMHRHHVKEVGGHFLEEWHQKLHNNTTPDDIVICEGYLAFLHAGGSREAFYDTLARGGVSRERLRSFERPIRTDPEFFPDKRDGLAHDFEHFLRILKSVHSGTDLDTAAGAARGLLDHSANDRLNLLYQQRREGAPLGDQAETITLLREELAARLAQASDAHVTREILYLDLALEQTLRAVVEQQPDKAEDVAALTRLAWMILRNLSLGAEGEEFASCSRQLQKLVDVPGTDRQWALHVKSVTDRAGRAIARWSEALYARLQPKAEYLGDAFEADEWTIPLFSEEVIRGGTGFMLSLLLRRLDPQLRARAGIGGWQVMSPGHAAGEVRVVDSLRAAQGSRFNGPTVLITDRVAGDEEIPEGVTSVITSDTPDLVSHVAVRARNAQVLFATCYDDARYQQLKQLAGRQLALDVSPAGDVEAHEAQATSSADDLTPAAPLVVRRRVFSKWAVGERDFNPEILGGKSNNLQALRGRLSDWIAFPSSIALPFGVFERVMAAPENAEASRRLADLQRQAAQAPDEHLPTLRRLLRNLAAPRELREALSTVWDSASLPKTDWERIWPAINKVWASKWNERAWYSRVARGIDHDDLMMAVLIQQVVAADYAFVLHTVKPINGRDDELLGELVLGLGETLVGNYPGRALGFVCRKSDLDISLLSYPSKRLGLYGSGVIFRSDSNGEDLERFAGAGLYDSVLAEAPQERLLDYTDQPLLWDEAFREQMLRKIARIGLEVEQVFGSAQDIEGAVQQERYYVVQTRPQVG